MASLCHFPHATPSSPKVASAASKQSASHLPSSVENVIWDDVVSILVHDDQRNLIRWLFFTFKTRWNWMYEIIDDDGIEGLAPRPTAPPLLLAVAMTAVLVSDPIDSLSAFSQISRSHGQDTAGEGFTALDHHTQLVAILEEAFVQSFRFAIKDGAGSIALCQAMFIFGVHCKTLSKDISLMGGVRYEDMATMMKRCALTSDRGKEKTSQVRRRIFWNVAAQDINYALSFLSKPAISCTEIGEVELPRYCKVDEATRQWRYVLVWFRARICRDVLEVAHQVRGGLDPAQEAMRRLQVTEMLLPPPFRVLREADDNFLLAEAKDVYLVRTRALIGMLFHKACEAVTRLAMVRFIPSSDAVLIRHACVHSAQETIRWMLRGRGAAKNRGDLYSIWQLAPAPSCFMSIVVAVVDEVRCNAALYTVSSAVYTWLNSLQEVLEYLDIICDTDRSRQLIHMYRSLYHKLQRLVCLERPPCLWNDDSELLSREQALERLGPVDSHGTVDRMLSTNALELNLENETWSDMDEWLPLFLGELV